MKPVHAVAGAAALLFGCSPAPVAYRGRADHSATPPADDAGSGAVPTSSTVPAAPEPDPTTTTTVTFVAPHATTTTTLAVLLPERADAGLSDTEWWAGQPGACGGSLPPCWVMMQESGGDPRAVNPTTGAAGKWQFMPSTSRAMGYPLPMDRYPESTQDAAAEALWAGGRGCAHWAACR